MHKSIFIVLIIVGYSIAWNFKEFQKIVRKKKEEELTLDQCMEKYNKWKDRAYAERALHKGVCHALCNKSDGVFQTVEWGLRSFVCCPAGDKPICPNTKDGYCKCETNGNNFIC